MITSESPTRRPPDSMAILVASELFAAAVGFGVMVALARRLGPSGFASYEYAAAVAGWWLVVVRGGFDPIVYREAARRPALVGPLTDLLLGLRLASAVAGLAAVAGFALASSADRGRVVAAAGLVLIPSALACDVGARASGRFKRLAMAQAIRSVGLAVGVAWLVAGPGDAWIAAGCVAAAEAASSALLWRSHRVERGATRPRFRRRAWAVLARRGAVAGVARFARVGLYAADLLILGVVAASTLGPYAAARRVAFALLALGLVVPSAIGPAIARAWASGAGEARRVVARTCSGLSLAALPATAGLMATADRWMPRLFGGGFAEGGPWLALIAARLPFVLASNVQNAALVACRREALACRLTLGMVALGVAILPPLAMARGAWGVGLGLLAIEAAGAACGWIALRSLGVAPPWHHDAGPALAGCAGLAIACRAGRGWPLGAAVVAAAAAYAVILLLSKALLAHHPSRLPPGRQKQVEDVAGPARIVLKPSSITTRRPTSLAPGPSPGGRGEEEAIRWPRATTPGRSGR